MTLETGVKALAEAVAVDVKALEDGKANSLHSHLIGDITGLSPRLNSIGNLNDLPTQAKNNLVAAINELCQSFAELIPQIDDDAGLGDTNVTWSADKSSRELADKVDKVAGKGLSDTNFTQAEKDKLSSLEGSKFVGLFVGESALPLSGSEGDYANVDGGVGSDAYRVIWDSSDNKWVKMQGVSTDLTPAQIKQQYESNPDTNAFTDDEKAKLDSVANGATANRADTLNADKFHTHDINDITGLSTHLNDIDALIGDVESVLVAINGEP